MERIDPQIGAVIAACFGESSHHRLVGRTAGSGIGRPNDDLHMLEAAPVQVLLDQAHYRIRIHPGQDAQIGKGARRTRNDRCRIVTLLDLSCGERIDVERAGKHEIRQKIPWRRVGFQTRDTSLCAIGLEVMDLCHGIDQRMLEIGRLGRHIVEPIDDEPLLPVDERRKRLYELPRRARHEGTVKSVEITRYRSALSASGHLEFQKDQAFEAETQDRMAGTIRAEIGNEGGVALCEHFRFASI